MYSSSKLTAFNDLLTQYNTAKTNYENTLDEFNKSVEIVTGGRYNGGTPTIYTDNTSYGYILKDKVLMKMEDIPASGGTTLAGGALDDSKKNTVVTIGGIDVFYTDKIYKGTITEQKDNIDKVVQTGLTDLNENLPSTNNSTEVYSRNSGGTKEYDSAASCTTADIYKCRSRAMFNNKPGYGLTSTDGVGCSCYIFDEVDVPTSQVSNTIKTMDVEISHSQISYLAIMRDGALYGLKDSAYHANFQKLYESRSGNELQQILAAPDAAASTNCNPFVGSDVNTVDITNIVGESCTLRAN